MTSLANKTVLITGASSGIGLETARRFAKEKARLLLCARRLDRLETLAQSLTTEYGCETYTVELDVSKKNHVDNLYQQLPNAWQDIDILINNAGIARGLHKLYEGNIEDWEEMIDTNMKGLLYMTRTILPRMVEKNMGHIINIGSTAGHQTYVKGNVYCATKYAVRALTESLRLDLFGTNIRVTLISPGLVETEFSEVRFHGDKKRAKTVYEGLQPLTGQDIADSIFYAASAPLHVNINEMIIMPLAQAGVAMVNRTATNTQ